MSNGAQKEFESFETDPKTTVPQVHYQHTQHYQMTTNEIDWKGVFKTVDVFKTVEEAMAKQNAPKLMYWMDLKADKPGYRWELEEENNSQWPDQAEDWDLEKVIEDGHASSELEACTYLYDYNMDFRDEMDALSIAELEHCEEQDRKRRMALWHRAAWTAVWCRRLRGPEKPVRWMDAADRELPCPKCKDVAAAQAANARGKRKASCCACGYTFKVVRSE